MNINRFKSSENIDRYLAEQMVESIHQNPQMNMGLPTGGTYIGFYEKTTHEILKSAIDVKSIQTFNLDRYHNQPKEDDSSYETFMRRHFFNPLDINAHQTHFPYYESPQDYGKYDQIIDNSGGLDIILLGIGVNAHIAFNEPGTSFESKTHKVMLSPSTINSNQTFFESKDQMPKEAVTMGISTILNAKKVILVAKGLNKAKAVYKMIYDRINESVPATALRLHENVEVYVDKEAGSLI